MATLEQIQAGIDFVEDHLEEEFDLADVARVAGMSRWHFQRVFKAVTRETLKAYIRSRRLSGALRRLRETDQRVIEIALLAGFESQEAFSRAFSQAFDMTPAQYRKLGKRNQFWKKLQLTPEYLASLGTNTGQAPEIRSFEELTLVGLATEYFGEGSEKNNVANKIPALWEAFIPRMSTIERRQAGMAYGVIRQTLDEDRLIYTAACPVERLERRTRIPEGMTTLEVAASSYAVFEHRGPVAKLDHTVSFAYSAWLLTSGRRHGGGPDLELYGPEYHPSSPDSRIYYAIPLE